MTNRGVLTIGERAYRARRVTTTFGRIYLGIKAHQFVARYVFRFRFVTYYHSMAKNVRPDVFNVLRSYETTPFHEGEGFGGEG